MDIVEETGDSVPNQVIHCLLKRIALVCSHLWKAVVFQRDKDAKCTS